MDNFCGARAFSLETSAGRWFGLSTLNELIQRVTSIEQFNLQRNYINEITIRKGTKISTRSFEIPTPLRERWLQVQGREWEGAECEDITDQFWILRQTIETCRNCISGQS